MRYEEVNAGVTREEGLVYPCDDCGVPEGIMCVYTSSSPRHARGDACQVIHPARRRRVHSARYDRYRAEAAQARLRASRDLAAAVRAAQARAALRAWDEAEHAALVAWWREHGHIFEEAGRQ